jgi:hypothetical protein
MKTKFAILFFITASVLISCKTTEEAVEANTSEVAEAVVAEPDQNPNCTLTVVNDDDSLFASISRSACYGRCPTYKMFIYNDGTVLLEGIRFMEPIGNYTITISKEEMQAFIDKANAIEYMKMDDRYDSPITDIPSATTSIVIDGVRKEVYRRHNYPKSILLFEQLFDNLLTSKEWPTNEE